MEHLPGQTLADKLLKGPLPLPQALDIAAQIAEALDAAHKHGVIHRDLKTGLLSSAHAPTPASFEGWSLHGASPSSDLFSRFDARVEQCPDTKRPFEA